MAETLAPTSIIASVNLQAFALTDIDEDPGADAGDWAAASTTATTLLQVGFATPSANPAGAQTFRALLRKTAGTPLPVATAFLLQSAATVSTFASVTISATAVHSFSWDASALTSNVSGSDVELGIRGVPGVGSVVGAQPAYANAASATRTNLLSGVFTLINPPTVNAGDLLVAQMGVRTSAGNREVVTGNAGWTAFPGNPYGAITNVRQVLYYRVATGSEGGQSLTFSVSNTGTTLGLLLGRIYRFTAANGFADPPIEAITNSAGTDSTMVGPPLTPGGTNRLGALLFAFGDDPGIGPSPFSVSGTTSWSSAEYYVTNIALDGAIGLQVRDMPTGGAIAQSEEALPAIATASSHWNVIEFAVVPSSSSVPQTTIEYGAFAWDASVTAAGALTLNATSIPLTVGIGTPDVDIAFTGRTYYYAESLSVDSTATTDFSAVKVSLVWEPNANAAHVIIWSAILSCDNPFTSMLARVQNTTSVATLAAPTYGPTSTADTPCYGGVAFYTADPTPSTLTFQLQYAGNGTNAVTIADATLLVLELEANDQTAASDATLTTVASLTAVTLTFDAGASPNDWLFIASAEIRTTNGASGPGLKVIKDGTDFGVHTPYDYAGESGNGGYYPFMHMVRGVSLTGSQSIAIEFWAQFGTDNQLIRNARIVALRLTEFGGYAWAEDRTLHNLTSTATVYVESAAKIDDFAVTGSRNYLLLAGGINTTSDTTRATRFGAIVERNTVTLNTVPHTFGTFAGNEVPWLMARRITETLTGTVSLVHLYSRLAGAENIATDENVIVYLLLDGATGAQALTLNAGSLTSSAITGRLILVMPRGIP